MTNIISIAGRMKPKEKEKKPRLAMYHCDYCERLYGINCQNFHVFNDSRVFCANCGTQMDAVCHVYPGAAK